MISYILNFFKPKKENIKTVASKTVYEDNDIKITSQLLVNTSSKKYDKNKLLNILNEQIGYTPEICNYEVNAICPYCKNDLNKKPTRRIKCKQCDNFILVRTHYETKEKVLLTETESDTFEAKAKVHYFKKDIKRSIISTFTAELDKNINLREHLLIKLEIAKIEWQWGIYCIMLRNLSDLDFLENKKFDSLKKRLEVIYLGVNKPHNRSSYIIENNLQKKYPAFTPYDDSVVSEYWVANIKNLANELNITSIEEIFIQHNESVYSNLKIVPHTPSVIWNRIKKHF
ncbi:MAG: hypothetical protein WC149_12115 [Arcobacteraceae bacterium]